MLDPRLKRDLNEAGYTAYRRTIFYEFDSRLKSRKLFTGKKGEIVYRYIHVIVTDIFDSNPRLVLGLRTDQDYFAYSNYGQLNELGQAQVIFQGDNVYTIFDRDTDIFIGLTGNATKGKGWILFDVLDTSLIKVT